jgi:hypothetical protein
MKRSTDYRYEACFIDLRDRMPVILVTTTREFGAVTLNLQQVFETAYARARYGDWVDYTAPPPPLPPADAAWVRDQVQRWLAAKAAQSAEG